MRQQSSGDSYTELAAAKLRSKGPRVNSVQFTDTEARIWQVLIYAGRMGGCLRLDDMDITRLIQGESLLLRSSTWDDSWRKLGKNREISGARNRLWVDGREAARE